MWYFTWILGVGLALAFGIINVMWLEASYTFGELDERELAERFARNPDDKPW
jgi:cytochrome bd-I ubiquinol oxidase subunit X